MSRVSRWWRVVGLEGGEGIPIYHPCAKTMRRPNMTKITPVAVHR